MINLIIADDEKITRDNLKQHIPWKELGIECVETAKNGQAALELAGIMKPDILLTDVRMPKMDGIELATKIRELYPKCKIIFLSGYADKEYLKHAIHISAVSYIEKPINIGEIKAVVGKAVELCTEDAKKEKESEKLKSMVAESAVFLRQEIVLELVENKMELSSLLKRYDERILNLPRSSFYTVIYILFNWEINMEENIRNNLRKCILIMLNNADFMIDSHCLPGFDTSGNMIMVFPQKLESSNSDSGNLLQHIYNKLSNMSEDCFSLSIGVGNPVESISFLQESYDNAVKAANRQFYLGMGKVYHHMLSDNTTYEIDKQFYQIFRKCLDNNQESEARKIISDLTNDIRYTRDNRINRIKNIYFTILLLIFEAAYDREIINPYGDSEKEFIWQEIDRFKTLSDISDYVLSHMQQLFAYSEEKGNINKKIFEIMRYIKDNISNPQLSVQTVANYSYLTQTYICAYFKKNTGKTLNEYITEIRMEKAKELLKDNRLKLYEVTSCVGLSDANYFSTLFKKYVGCTPSEYREKH